MGGRTDVVKGRIEEAAGVLAGSEKLRRKGRRDQAIGRTEQALDKTDAKAARRMHN